MNCDYTFLKAINTFKDCLQTLGTLCREGTKIICQAKDCMHYYLCCSYKDELLVFCEIFFEVSILRDAEHNLVHFYFLPVALQMCPPHISNLYLSV